MRGRARATVGAAVALLLLATACGEPAPVPPTPSPAMPLELVADCGDLRLPLAVLSNPLGAESEDSPSAEAPRHFLELRVPAGEDPSTETFRVLRAGPDEVLYGSEGEVAHLIEVTRADGTWTAREARSCAPALELPGLHAGPWRLEPGVATAPDTRTFTALVTERPCGDGRPAGDRVLAPLIRREPGRILVIFGIVPPAGPAPVPCPQVPPARYAVDLGEPLGARQLLDGGTIPPNDPYQPTCCG